MRGAPCTGVRLCMIHDRVSTDAALSYTALLYVLLDRTGPRPYLFAPDNICIQLVQRRVACGPSQRANTKSATYRGCRDQGALSPISA